jgi:hypothetical protein
MRMREIRKKMNMRMRMRIRRRRGTNRRHTGALYGER